MPIQTGVATVAQPFYTDEGFWTLFLMGLFNILIYLKWIPTTTDVTVIVNFILGIMAFIFHWNSDQPLTTSGPSSGAQKLPAASVVVGR